MFEHLNYQPFSYFWLNCQLNNVFSVLVSVEPSYRFAAFLNDYSYNINKLPIGNHSTVRFLDLNYKDGLKKYIQDVLIYKKDILSNQDSPWSKVVSIEKYYFKSPDRFLEEIQDLLKNGQSISVGVNLYYWVMGSIAYEKYHYNHYSLITGYNEEKHEYHTFDDDLFGYKLHMIPEERLCTAFSKSDLKEPPAFLINVFDNVRPYKLTINDVLNCADTIRKNIASIDIDNLWDVDALEKDFCEAIDNCVINANRVVNRHIGNKFLFESLYTLGIVKDKNSIDKYMKIEDELIEGWIEVKNVIAMCKYSGKNILSIEKIDGLDKKLLRKEINIWTQVLEEFA